jgi:hypothetical protein
MRIPPVRSWRVTVLETGERYTITAPTRRLARIIFRTEYPKHWGAPISIGLPRKETNR